MKRAINEIRLYIAELLLSLIWDILPNSVDGNRIRRQIFHYFKTKIK